MCYPVSLGSQIGKEGSEGWLRGLERKVKSVGKESLRSQWITVVLNGSFPSLGILAD